MERRTETQLARLLQLLEATQEDELDCETCDEQLDKVIEQVAAGAELRDLLPLVAQHLNCCGDCHEMYEALLAVLQAERNGKIPVAVDD